MLLCVFVQSHLSSTTKTLNNIYFIKQAAMVFGCRLFNALTYIEDFGNGLLIPN